MLIILLLSLSFNFSVVTKQICEQDPNPYQKMYCCVQGDFSKYSEFENFNTICNNITQQTTNSRLLVIVWATCSNYLKSFIDCMNDYHQYGVRTEPTRKACINMNQLSKDDPEVQTKLLDCVNDCYNFLYQDIQSIVTEKTLVIQGVTEDKNIYQEEFKVYTMKLMDDLYKEFDTCGKNLELQKDFKASEYEFDIKRVENSVEEVNDTEKDGEQKEDNQQFIIQIVIILLLFI